MPLLPLVLVASIWQASGQDMECQHALRDQEQRQTRTVQDDFTLTVRRKADPSLTTDACVVEVRDPSGRVVFMREGYNTRVHGETGRDVDNDGFPDIIIAHDAGDGRRCCSEHTMLSLRPALHVVGVFANPGFDIDMNRRTVVWDLLPLDALATDWGPTPTIVIASQYRNGRFVEITTEYCPVILAGTARGWASLSEDLWRLEGSNLAASRNETGPPSFAVETTRGSATLVASQMMYCGRDAEARELILRAWPSDAQETIRAAIAGAVAAVRRRYRERSGHS